jgi:hypothetical protein
MITPFKLDDLFEVSRNINPIYDRDTNAIIIDNYYKNFEEICNVLQNLYVPNWKISESSRNFVDYYDCRPIFSQFEVSQKRSFELQNMVDLINHFFPEKRNLYLENSHYEFNFFKHIQNLPDKKMQHFPHTDDAYNAIIYLDEISSGGTAIYDMQKIENNEKETLFYDVSDIPKKIIPAKPNRLVLFDGSKMHGGYIDNHNSYVNNWRINQVLFFKLDN